MNAQRTQLIVDTAIATVAAAGFAKDNAPADTEMPNGRQHFKRCDGIKVTIGEQTIHFYRVAAVILGRPRIALIGSASTRNIKKIQALIKMLPRADEPAVK